MDRVSSKQISSEPTGAERCLVECGHRLFGMCGLIGEMEADSVEGQDSMEKILDQMNQSFENTEETIPTTKLYQVAKSFLEQLGKVSA